MTYDDDPELDELENPLLWPTGLDEPLPTDEEAERATYVMDAAAYVEHLRRTGAAFENAARRRRIPRPVFERNAVLPACDEVCRAAGLDPRNVAAWGELKGELLAAVERHGITGTDRDLDEPEDDPPAVFFPEGWWHPNCKDGRVHEHPADPGRSWSEANHRSCEPVYTYRPVSADEHEPEDEHDPYRVPDPFYDADPPDDDPTVMSALRHYHERKARSQR